MSVAPLPRLTPWVGRIIAVNAVVLLLLMTLFTSPALITALEFSPTDAFRRPWSFLTYMFVHAGLLHLATNMLMLYVFGTRVEARMGSRRFILYYLLCGFGAALLSIALAGLYPNPFVGASGAVLGIALAFAMYWPDAEILVFPIPIPIRARTLVAILVALDVVGAILLNDRIAHVAHVGGVLSGFLYFRIQGFAHRPRPEAARPVERVVMVQSGAPEPERRSPVTPIRPRRRIDADPVAAEVDRVLDKISEKGIASLTPAERKFLDEVSRQKKQEH